MNSRTGKALKRLADQLDEARAVFGRFDYTFPSSLRELAELAEEERESLVSDLGHYGAVYQCHECGCYRRRDEMSDHLPELYCDICAPHVSREYRENSLLQAFLDGVMR